LTRRRHNRQPMHSRQDLPSFVLCDGCNNNNWQWPSSIVFGTFGTKQFRRLQCWLNYHINGTTNPTNGNICTWNGTQPTNNNPPKRVIFLRDPLERYLSAFLDKCLDDHYRIYEGHHAPSQVFASETNERLVYVGTDPDKSIVHGYERLLRRGLVKKVVTAVLHSLQHIGCASELRFHIRASKFQEFHHAHKMSRRRIVTSSFFAPGPRPFFERVVWPWCHAIILHYKPTLWWLDCCILP
jgi:hypothetical protein